MQTKGRSGIRKDDHTNNMFQKYVMEMWDVSDLVHRKPIQWYYIYSCLRDFLKNTFVSASCVF